MLSERDEGASAQELSLPTHARPIASQQAPVLTVYAHTCRDLASLAAHRRTAHRDTCFVDHFHSGCTCGIGFRSRAAATKHAMACKDSSYFAAAAARDSSLCSPLLTDSRSEVAPTPTGPLSAAVLAITADASSATVTAGAANTQSIVPAAPVSAGHQYVPPPVRCPTLSPPQVRVAGKRRRLNDPDAELPRPDLDVVMQVTDGVMDQASAQAASLPNTPRPFSQCATAQQTRWGPRLLTDDATAPTLAVRRPLTPAASVTGATRWGHDIARSGPPLLPIFFAMSIAKPILRLIVWLTVHSIFSAPLWSVVTTRETCLHLQTFADGMASRITDADCWATGEGYISAIPDRIPAPPTSSAHARRGCRLTTILRKVTSSGRR
ncbi:hypothetical protein KXD40_001116 [Peronospora effusa]|nr:hypothetical protein KXD40_001116 [Peronospora effusa]